MAESIKVGPDSSKKLLLSGSIIIAVLLLAGVFVYNPFTKTNPLGKEDTLRLENYYKSLLQNDPVPLQNSFLSDVKDGKNDKYTKSDAYFITHRFFDNSGNIYEIYDYVNAHPELAFLKEAESIYPTIFAKIKDRTLPAYFVDRSLYADMAYMEVLYKNGYTDIAAISTIANQYAKTAYFTTTIAKEMSKEAGSKRSKYASRDSEKAIEFLKAGAVDINKVIKGEITTSDITARDMLVGLNQYAAAIRYLDAIGKASSTPMNIEDSKKIFEFTTELAHREVPELRHFTSLLNASTLAILPSSTPEEVRAALFPILDTDMSNPNILKTSILHKVIDTRFEVQPKDIGDSYQDIYSKRNTLRLASKVPEFKEWLKKNGWTDQDFKLK